MPIKHTEILEKTYCRDGASCLLQRTGLPRYPLQFHFGPHCGHLKLDMGDAFLKIEELLSFCCNKVKRSDAFNVLSFFKGIPDNNWFNCKLFLPINKGGVFFVVIEKPLLAVKISE